MAGLRVHSQADRPDEELADGFIGRQPSPWSTSVTTRAHLDDRQIAVHYLADKLSTPDIEAFEEHYLEHPDVVEELELDAKLKAGLMCIRDSGELDRLTTVRKGSWAVTPIAIAAS